MCNLYSSRCIKSKCHKEVVCLKHIACVMISANQNVFLTLIINLQPIGLLIESALIVANHSSLV